MMIDIIKIIKILNVLNESVSKNVYRETNRNLHNIIKTSVFEFILQQSFVNI
jgi:hypothetical protein